MDCCRFEAVDIYADKESTTALTKASLASERLDETERSTAVGLEEQKRLVELTSFVPFSIQKLPFTMLKKKVEVLSLDLSCSMNPRLRTHHVLSIMQVG